MAHGEHDHEHGHHRHHVPPGKLTVAFAVGVILNVGFVIAEAALGAWANSVALIADAAHNLGDVLGLLLAWGAMALAQRGPAGRRTYGYGKSTILAALANAVLIFIAAVGVAWEGASRLFSSEHVASGTVIVVAAVGVLINGVSALLFLRARERDANIRGAFLHLATDAAVSLGVVLAGVGMFLTGYVWIDPVISLVVSVVIAVATWGLLRGALNMAMDAAPDHIDVDQVQTLLAAQEGVESVHDLHIWAMSTTETALTAHVVVRDSWIDSGAAALLPTICRQLHERFNIDHATVQLESAAVARACRLAQGGVV